jgi:hypothetical protein
VRSRRFELRIVKGAVIHYQRAFHKVNVRVDQTGQNGGAVRLHHFGLFAHERLRADIVTDEDYSAGAYRDRLG